MIDLRLLQDIQKVLNKIIHNDLIHSLKSSKKHLKIEMVI